MELTDNRVMKVDMMFEMFQLLTHDFEYKDEYCMKRIEYITLIHIWKFSGRTMGYYANRAGLEKSSFTYVADKLEGRGFIERVDSETDKRKKVLVLTPVGLDLVKKIDEKFSKHITKRLNYLDAEEQERFFDIMNELDEMSVKIKSGLKKSR